MEKIIFLDIDGVLNSEEYFIKRKKTYIKEFRLIDDLDEESVERLNKIIDNTNAEIVLSSSWRIPFSLTEINEALKYRGFKYKIKYTTTKKHMDRGQQILKFIEEYEVKNYIVIDDEAFDIKKYISDNQFVKTEWKTGLLDNHVDYIISYFKLREFIKYYNGNLYEFIKLYLGESFSELKSWQKIYLKTLCKIKR